MDWSGALSLSVAAGACFALAGLLALGVVWWLLRRRGATDEAEPHVLRDWLTTGRINFVANPKIMESEDENIPANFVLRVEESRLVADISGSPNLEIRWRSATKMEAKDVASQYHQHLEAAFDVHKQATPYFGMAPSATLRPWTQDRADGTESTVPPERGVPLGASEPRIDEDAVLQERAEGIESTKRREQTDP